MAANTTGMRVEGTMVIGTEGKHGQGQSHRNGAYGSAAAALGIVALIAGLLLHASMGTVATHTTAPAPAGLVGTSMGQAEYDAIRVSLEKVVGGTAPAVQTSAQQRFIEENTILPGTWASPYMEAMTPLPGQDR